MFNWLFSDDVEGRDPAAPAPASGVQLSLVSVSDNFLALHNAGGASARGVRVDVDRSSIVVVNRVDEPFDLDPGESWTFLIEDLGPWTDDGWHLTVTWEDQAAPVCVPLPPGAL